MCRAGGRRCDGSNSSDRATQNTRQQRSRAKRALRKAQASGDAEAVRKATERLAAASAAHTAAKEEAVARKDKHDETEGHGRDVTGAPTCDQQEQRHHDAQFGVQNTNIAEPGAHVGSQNDVNHDNFVQSIRSNSRQNEQGTGSAAHDGDVTAEHPRMSTGAPGITNIATPGSFVAVQAGKITGEVRVNGHRVNADSAVQQGDVTASDATQQQQGDSSVHTGHSDVFRTTNVAFGNVGVQAGVVHGAVVDGHVVNPGQTGSNSGARLSREEVQRAQDNARRAVEQAHRQAAHAREQARRMREAARQSGDVTRSTFHTGSGGTVTNIVYGENYGIQTDVVNGPIHFGPGGFTIGTPQDDDQ